MQQAGQTALLLAAGGGHASVVKLLLDAKADVDSFNNVRDEF
jgi:ankyrin repeat protein